jgi:hypothetical protein
LDARDIWAFDGSNFKSLGNQRVKKYFFDNLNPAYSQRTYVINNTQKNQIEIYYPDMESTGWCNKMLSYRYDLDIFNAPRDISSGSHAAEGPIFEDGAFNASSRTVVYTRGVENSKIVQKDRTTTFIGPTPITSQFRRDNISLGLKYSQQALLHRILPEVVNLNIAGLPVTSDAATGNITVTIGGSNSVGQQPVFRPAVTMAIDTDNPWTQINQNAFRVNSIELGDTSSTHTWQCTAVNWQFTPTEDSR